MEWLEQLQTWWNEYYPLVVGGITAIGGIVAIGVTLWFKVQPLLEKINIIKDKVTDTSAEDVTSKIQSISLETQITDLNAKIENPTISDTLKQQYIKQLASLEIVKAKMDAGLATVEETTNKYV